VDIDLPKLLLRIRAGSQVNKTGTKNEPNAPAPLSIGLKLFTIAASSPKSFAVAQWFAGAFGSLVRFFSEGDPWIHLPKWSGWGYSKDFPTPAARTFRSRFQKHTEAVQKVKNRDLLSDKIPIFNPSIVVTKVTQNRKRTDDFASEVEAIGGKFMLCSPEETAKVVLDILRSKGIDQLLAWESPYISQQLSENLLAEGIQIIHPTADTLEASSKVLAGLTGASAGITDTGSLLLLGGSGRPMTTSLLPQTHIALLNEEDIFENLDEVLDQIDIMEAPSAVLVTGPSRTADIEMTLTIGVHGPGELYVICIKGELEKIS
jgi:L-lactate dehydrogenase complex protein LldG